jgi:protein SCO1/2
MMHFPHNFFSRRRIASAIAAASFLFAGIAGTAPVARAEYGMGTQDVGPVVLPPNPTVVARPNAPIPLDLTFTSSNGATTTLASLFNHGKPVVLEMVYLNCPYMCGENQKNLANRIREGLHSLTLGKDFDVVIVSIDPEDTPARAAETRHTYLQTMGLPDSQPGFTYLTGTEDNIRALANAIGFGYQRNLLGGDKYLHSTAVFVSTPYARLSKTITNLGYTSDELHAALIAAADGKIGSGILETIALPCGAMRLNPQTGKYEANPWFWFGTAGGAATVAAMGIFLGTLWRGEAKRKRSGIDNVPASPPQEPPPDAPVD